jgi:thiamine pyrophosphate-dependent acetolactate synthase large subunit-like protein
MDLVDALKVLHERRTDEIIITTMGTGREWTNFAPHPLDFVYVPSSMGQSTSVGLGLAIAQPNRKVIACNGDGSMLMNLGSLVTITSKMPANLIVVLFDNACYEVTGRQPTPGGAELRATGRAVDFAAVAKACGFETVFEFDSLPQWESGFAEVLAASGPVFVVLSVAPKQGDVGPKSPGPAWERAQQFRENMLR